MPRLPILSTAICHALLVAGTLSSPSGVIAADHFHSRVRPQPNVPPMEELEILDPRVDAEGKPRAVVLPGMNGLPQVQIPPTVIVHRYYYTGDRDFQGPMLQGGPTVFTVNDPTTGEQVYVEVLLPPGSPRVKYRRDRIVYDYPTQAVTVCFGHPGPLGLGRVAKPSVSICHHSPAVKNAAQHADKKRQEIGDWWTRTGVTQGTTQAVQTCKQCATNSADAIQTVGTAVTTPLVAIWKATPLSGLTSSQVPQPNFNEPGIR